MTHVKSRRAVKGSRLRAIINRSKAEEEQLTEAKRKALDLEPLPEKLLELEDRLE